jgi:hypothetical protein
MRSSCLTEGDVLVPSSIQWVILDEDNPGNAGAARDLSLPELCFYRRHHLQEPRTAPARPGLHTSGAANPATG